MVIEGTKMGQSGKEGYGAHSERFQRTVRRTYRQQDALGAHDAKSS